jgi:hypothetical protein
LLGRLQNSKKHIYQFIVKDITKDMGEQPDEDTDIDAQMTRAGISGAQGS